MITNCQNSCYIVQLISAFICLLVTWECSLHIKWKTQKQYNNEAVKDVIF